MDREFMSGGFWVEKQGGRGYPAKPLTRQERLSTAGKTSGGLSILELKALVQAEQIAIRLIPELAGK